MIDLSIIIVSFNTKEYLKKCLESIVKFTSSNLTFEIIVVDNASNDGSVEEIQNLIFKNQKYNEKVKIIKNDNNYGFSKANNLGIKEAKGRYLLFLNSDTEILDQDALVKMVAFMDYHEDAGAASCFLQLPDKSLDDAAHRGFPTPWNAFCHFTGIGKVFPRSQFFNGYHLGWKNLDKVHEIDALAGAFAIVRRKAGESVGWWDEDYFFYGEDLDLCYKLKQKGWKIYFVPTVKVLHYKGLTSGIKKTSAHLTNSDIERKRMITNARFEAMRIFYNKHYLMKYPRLLTSLVLIGINLKKYLTILRYK